MEVMLPYTQRHYARVQGLVKTSYMLDFTLDQMQAYTTAADDEDHARLA